MGNSSSKTVQSSIEAVNKMVNESYLSATNSCKVDVALPQTIKFTCDVSDETTQLLASAEAECKGTYASFFGEVDSMTPSQIRAMGDAINSACPPENYKACVVSGISQDAVVSSRVNCQIDNDMVNDLKADLQQRLENAASNETDAFGEALVNATRVLNPGGSDEEVIESKTKIITDIVNTINVDLVNEIQSQYDASQTLQFEGQSYSLKDVAQTMTLDIVTQALSQNTTLAETATKVSNETKNEASSQDKGLTDIFETFGELFSNPWFIGGVIAVVVLMFVLALLG